MWATDAWASTMALARTLLPELMDDPALDAAQHDRALAGLARINRLSRSSAILWRALRPLAQRSANPLRVLDVATGAGDVPIGLWRRATAAGVRLDLSACDISAQALRHAAARAARYQSPIRFFEWNAVEKPLETDYDVVMCSLFLHHLDEPSAISLLRNLAAAARTSVLVNDLRRCRRGLALAYLGTQLLSRSPVVHVDGPRSVRGAFEGHEALELAERAGLSGATVEHRWPFRFLLQWRRS